MKLVITVVQDTDADNILRALGEMGIQSTRINSAGGYLRERNVTLMIGVVDERVPEVIEIVEQNSTARRKFVNPLMPFALVDGNDDASVRVGASVFILNVRRFEQLTG